MVLQETEDGEKILFDATHSLSRTKLVLLGGPNHARVGLLALGSTVLEAFMAWVAGHLLRKTGSSRTGVDFSASADMSHMGEKRLLLACDDSYEHRSAIHARIRIWMGRALTFEVLNCSEIARYWRDHPAALAQRSCIDMGPTR